MSGASASAGRVVAALGPPGPLGPLGYGRQSIDAADLAAVAAALQSDWLTQGPLVPRFEAALAAATGAAQAVVASNGTAALHLALLGLGIGPGSRVLTSANTFLASATAALHCGAEAEFVDIDPRSMNLSVDELAERLRRAPRVDAVVGVHFAGRPFDLAAVLELKRRHGFALVADACHALGATLRAGGRSWRVGEHPELDATVLSFHPVKHVTTGEGGAVLCGDAARAARMRRLASHGMDPAAEIRPFDENGDEKGENAAEKPRWFNPMVELGWNYRLTEMQAALGLSQLARLDAFVARRAELAWRYESELPEWLARPERTLGHAWHLYVARAPAGQRDALVRFLAERRIRAQVHYYPVPLQPYFRARLAPRAYPRAEEHARTALSLPLFPGMRDADQDRVIEAIREFEA